MKMLNHICIDTWHPVVVRDWLVGVLDDTSWLKPEIIIDENITGKKLLLMNATDLCRLGATKVGTQELILEAIENLRNYYSNMSNETLQTMTLKLACQARSLQRELSMQNYKHNPNSSHQKAPLSRDNSITLSTEFKLENKKVKDKQRVSLNTLASVSSIVATVRQISSICSCKPFSKYVDYKSMKSLVLLLSIELTSTAQRDQFVEKPNDIIEKSAKALADYCDLKVLTTKDALLIQPFYLATVRIERTKPEADIGLVIGSHSTNSGTYYIEKLVPLSQAKKTNKLNEGDEVILFNQCIVGWSSKNVRQLLDNSSQQREIILTVKKLPNE